MKKAGGLRKGGSEPLTGKQLRKDRRKVERRDAKKRSIPLVANFEAHDGSSRQSKRKTCLFISGLQRAIEREEARLTHINKKPPAAPRTSGLKGPARPAWEKYPELYPEMHVVEPEEPAVNLLERNTPHCFAHEETKLIVGLHFQLGFAHLLQREETKARSAFRQALQLDESDPLNCCRGTLFASNQANAFKLQGDEGVDALFHIAVVRGTEDDVNKAVRACPEIALTVANAPVFSKTVEVEWVVAAVREERERRVARLVSGEVKEDKLISRCDAGLAGSNAGALAVCYFALYSHLWVKKTQLLAWLSTALEGEELGSEEEQVEEGEEAESGEASSQEERKLENMFEEAYAKLQ